VATNMLQSLAAAPRLSWDQSIRLGLHAFDDQKFALRVIALWQFLRIALARSSSQS